MTLVNQSAMMCHKITEPYAQIPTFFTIPNAEMKIEYPESQNNRALRSNPNKNQRIEIQQVNVNVTK